MWTEQYLHHFLVSSYWLVPDWDHSSREKLIHRATIFPNIWHLIICAPRLSPLITCHTTRCATIHFSHDGQFLLRWSIFRLKCLNRAVCTQLKIIVLHHLKAHSAQSLFYYTFPTWFSSALLTFYHFSCRILMLVQGAISRITLIKLLELKWY